MICKYCGKEFYAENKRQIYCCCEHRIAFNAEKAIKRKKELRKKKNLTYMVCGKELPEKRHKYCSDKCLKAYGYKKDIEEHKVEYKKLRKENKNPKKVKLTIAQITMRAKKEGLTYGQYCAKYGV